tara:strand:- start:700 stop:1062 length:363 start_codon:yes stop_codon:yes gene_type:complete
MQLSRLKNRLRYWQRQLGLEVWKIDVAYVMPHEIQCGYGSNTYDTNHRTAVVRILDPAYADMFQAPAPAYDAENVLVHELLHLLLIPVVDIDGEPDNTSVEQLINLLAEVLIHLSQETQQ